ncbi:hypothetical protein JYT53_00855 [Cytophagaceae bacterium AH-315-L13]|nr:hypothetical protein [Cytophagaceae bacterium AH-315-L13]
MQSLLNIVISFEDYSSWFILLCVMLGCVYAFILYRKSKAFSDSPKWISLFLSILRAATITILAILLLNPLITSLIRHLEKPIIIFAQDESESITIAPATFYQIGDSSNFKTKYPQQVNNLLEDLSENYEIRTYQFGSKLKLNAVFTFKEKQTDISALFKDIESRYDNRNIGAIIISSDGLYNKGINPIYASQKISAPIYTIAMGDTTIQKDLKITKVRNNELTFLGNNFPIEISINADQCQGDKTLLKIIHNDRSIFQKELQIDKNAFSTIISTTLKANQKGVQHYKLQLSSIEGEISYQNNIKDIFIDVIDSRQKILILAHAPHPDLSVLKSALEQNQNYEVQTILFKQITNNSLNIDKYNLAILHQLPSKNNNAQPIVNELKANEIPTLYIIGTQSWLSSFNNLKLGMQINHSRNRHNEVQANINTDFDSFTLSEDLKLRVIDFPPLIAPFGNYLGNNLDNTLLYQKIGNVNSSYPLLTFLDKGSYKIGILVGEGIWKWKLQEYAQYQNHNSTNELITKTVQYLATKSDKRQFRLVNTNSTFLENEVIKFDAEVYNDSYELITDPEISIKFTDSKDKSFPYTFNKTSNSYSLEAGFFKSGTYQYETEVQIGKELHHLNGTFTVKPIQIESQSTVADHQLLYNLAKSHGGEIIYPAQIEGLPEKINQREDMQSISYTTKTFQAIINLPGILILLILLLTVEWFVRKREGGI